MHRSYKGGDHVQACLAPATLAAWRPRLPSPVRYPAGMTCQTRPGELIELSAGGMNETQIAQSIGVTWGHYRAAINQWRPDISYVVRLARAEYLAEKAETLKLAPAAYARLLTGLAITQRGMLDSIRVARKRGIAIPLSRQRPRRLARTRPAP